MFKIIKRWVFWWKKSRASKKFFKEAIMIARHGEPDVPTPEKIQAVIDDWKRVGIDITKPNFGGGTQNLGI